MVSEEGQDRIKPIELTVDNLKREFARPHYNSDHWVRNWRVRDRILNALNQGTSLADACKEAHISHSRITCTGASWASRLFRYSTGPVSAIQRILEAAKKYEVEIFPEDRIGDEPPLDAHPSNLLSEVNKLHIRIREFQRKLAEAERIFSLQQNRSVGLEHTVDVQAQELREMRERLVEQKNAATAVQEKLQEMEESKNIAEGNLAIKSKVATEALEALHKAEKKRSVAEEDLVAQSNATAVALGALRKAEEGKRIAEGLLELAHRKGIVDVLWDRLQRAVIGVYAKRVQDLQLENERAVSEQLKEALLVRGVRGQLKAATDKLRVLETEIINLKKTSAQETAAHFVERQRALSALQQQVNELEKALDETMQKAQVEKLANALRAKEVTGTSVDEKFKLVKHSREGVTALAGLLQDPITVRQMIFFLARNSYSGFTNRDIAAEFCKQPANIDKFSQALAQYMRSKNIRNQQELRLFLESGRQLKDT